MVRFIPMRMRSAGPYNTRYENTSRAKGNRDMSNRRIKLQQVLIYGIIIAAFLGSALLFSYLNTGAMKSAVEKETDLAASILATDMQIEFPARQGVLVSEALARELDTRLNRALDNSGVEIDVWAVDDTGNVLYNRGGDFPTNAWQSTERSSPDSSLSSMRWIGEKSPFWLNQSLYLERRMDGSRIYLVVLNHCSAIRAVQRSQFALFVSIELVLILVTIVLLTNTISNYRRLLIQLATTDELTGLSNRKSFLSAFAEFTKRHEQRDFALFLVDIDYFKRINDSYGHGVGDLALQTLSRNIHRVVGQHGGFAGRWGGDEFIGVLPLGAEAARDALSGMCRDVQAERIEGEVHITISAGVAVGEPGISLERLSEMADRALYHAKAMGKNQASLYDPAYELTEDDVTAAPERVESVKKTEEKVEKKAAPTPEEESLSLGQRLKRYLKTRLVPSTLLGVRWMAPFVAGGGILIGLAFLFDAASVNLATLPVTQRANFGTITHVAAMLKGIGDSTFNFMLPAFAGFMAYGLAGENAFMAGFVGGYMTIDSQSGFIGAMIAGFAAGLIATQMERFMEHMPGLIHKAAPIIIYPVFNLVLMQVISMAVISPLAQALGSVFTRLLDSAVSSNSLWAGALSGGMMALDMGGIVNKVAYNYGVAGLASGQTVIMASVMAGGMTPPLGIVLSMLLFKRKFTQAERDRSVGTLFMGLSFITEGALPFVFSDALRVVPACILGSAFAGQASSAFGCALPAPHGGMFVIPVMEHPFLYILALAGGALLTALALGLMKKAVGE